MAIAASMRFIKSDRVLNKPLIIAISLLSIVAGLALPNGFYIFICLLTISFIISLLWRFGKPGILPFAFLFQWVQVFAFVVWMNVMGKDINYTSPNGGLAVVCSCVGLFSMALVCSWVINRLPNIQLKDLIREAATLIPSRVLILYLVSSTFLGSLGFVLGNRSGLAQVLLAVSSLKWIFFTAYGFMAFCGNGKKNVFFLIAGFEFLSGFYSYFSSFKEVIFYGIMIALTLIRTISIKQFFLGLIFSVSMFFLMLAWTAIKQDYRGFVNQGQSKQVVAVSRSEAYSRIGENVSNLSWARLNTASTMLLSRLQYVYHFAKTMDRVPSLLPHENGGMWASNLSFVFIPRILNPSKPAFEATVKTKKYTGLNYWGAKEGASFSLGYFADSYVDFGAFFMYIPLMLIAGMVGFIYQVFFRMRNLNLLLRIALINTSLYNFNAFESDGIIIVGRLYTTFVILYLVARFVFPPIQKWASKKKMESEKGTMERSRLAATNHLLN